MPKALAAVIAYLVINKYWDITIWVIRVTCKQI